MQRSAGNLCGAQPGGRCHLGAGDANTYRGDCHQQGVARAVGSGIRQRGRHPIKPFLLGIQVGCVVRVSVSVFECVYVWHCLRFVYVCGLCLCLCICIGTVVDGLCLCTCVVSCFCLFLCFCMFLCVFACVCVSVCLLVFVFVHVCASALVWAAPCLWLCLCVICLCLLVFLCVPVSAFVYLGVCLYMSNSGTMVVRQRSR